MNSVMRPSGPESVNTYWIRRAIVVVAALLALGMIWWVLSGLFRGGDQGTVAATPQNPSSLAQAGGATPTPSTSASPSASPSATASTSDSPSPSASPSSASATPTPSQPTTCGSDGLTLAIDGDKAPKAGAAVALTVILTNGGNAACKLDLAKAPVQVQVTSGSDRIWTTVHCSKWAPTSQNVVELAPGKAFSTSVTWPGKRSADGCTLRSEKLQPGTYRATVSADGAEPATLVMNLK
ncbi:MULTISPECIES: DUF4232 domain-containing protein [unclassified Luteococcus]|uniref:DUF4232 domain-containing protein n=1 Tax=unclassified Luteococcus TaxID=2639923 RepID=UPI00313EB2E4